MSSFPLGLQAESTYSVIEMDLNKDDLTILYSDGLVEAANETGELFGFQRTAETVRQAGISGTLGSRAFSAAL